MKAMNGVKKSWEEARVEGWWAQGFEQWDGKILPDAPHFSPDHKNNLTEKKKLDDRTLPKSGHQVRILEGVCAAGEQAWVAFLPRPLTPTPQQHKVTHVERVREISGQFREKGSWHLVKQEDGKPRWSGLMHTAGSCPRKRRKEWV